MKVQVNVTWMLYGQEATQGTSQEAKTIGEAIIKTIKKFKGMEIVKITTNKIK